MRPGVVPGRKVCWGASRVGEVVTTVRSGNVDSFIEVREKVGNNAKVLPLVIIRNAFGFSDFKGFSGLQAAVLFGSARGPIDDDSINAILFA